MRCPTAAPSRGDARDPEPDEGAGARRAQHRLRSAGRPVGTATSQTSLGECVIEFAHDAAAAELTLTLVKKPWLLPEGVLWSGFTATLERCRTEP